MKPAWPSWGYSLKGPTMRWPKSLSVSRWTRGRPRKCRNAEGGHGIERVVLSYVRWTTGKKSGSSSCPLRRDAGGRECPKRIWPKSGRGSKRVRESCVCVFVCLFVFVHVCNTSVGMFILKLQYVQVFTYSMLTITYYILSYVNRTWETFCTTFSLFEQRFVPIKCQTSGKKREQNQRIRIMVNLVCLKFARLFCPV